MKSGCGFWTDLGPVTLLLLVEVVALIILHGVAIPGGFAEMSPGRTKISSSWGWRCTTSLTPRSAFRRGITFGPTSMSQKYSWFAGILPYLEASETYNRLDWKDIWSSGNLGLEVYWGSTTA